MEKAITGSGIERERQRIAQMEADLQRRKAALKKNIRGSRTKALIILGSYLAADADRLRKVVTSPAFGAYLSDRDKAFLDSVGADLFPDVFSKAED